jgi:hypothetical protein
MNPGTVNTPVLTSWKDIARYMGKGVRTVQRWEQDFGLPVRRPLGSNKKAVLARPSDLDAWVALRCSSRKQGDCVPGDGGRLPVGALTSLAAQLQTARMLQTNNRALMMEVATALTRLRTQLTTLQNGH